MKIISWIILIVAPLLFPVVSYAQIAPGTINARQTGTWTVQPGNTANTTAWLVTGTGGTFPATQSGTWTVQPGNTANTTAWLVDVTPASPVATDYLPARITDGTAFIAPLAEGTFTGRINTQGQKTMAASTPVVIASDQSAISTTPGALTSLVTGQQAVTATAAVLPTNTAKEVCLKVLIAGTQDVFFGPSTVTTSNGQQLAAGDSVCMAISNSNLVYVIAASTGSTVGFHVLN